MKKKNRGPTQYFDAIFLTTVYFLAIN